MMEIVASTQLLWLSITLPFRSTLASEPEWDYFVFTQQWPQSVCNEGMQEKNATCKIPSSIDYWTIHGLWPEGYKSVPHCPKNPPFDRREIEELVPRLDLFWPDIFSTVKFKFWFWEHEWETHGTCAASLPETKTEKLYFQKGLELRQKYDILRTLKDCGIRPSDSKPYHKQDILNCYQRKFRMNVHARCFKHQKANRYELTETRICVTKNFTLMDCTERTAIKERSHKGKGTIECPDTGIYYPPIKHH